MRNRKQRGDELELPYIDNIYVGRKHIHRMFTLNELLRASKKKFRQQKDDHNWAAKIAGVYDHPYNK